MSRFTQERSKKIAHGIKDYTGCPKKIPFPRLLSCANLIYTTFYLIIYIILQKPSYSIHPVISCNILKNRFVLFLHIINMSLLCSCSFLCQPQLLCIWLSWIHIYCMHLKYSKVFLYAEGLAPSQQHKPVIKLLPKVLFSGKISFTFALPRQDFFHQKGQKICWILGKL